MSFEALAFPLALVVAALGATRLASAAARTAERELPFGVRVLAGFALLTAAAGWLVAARAYSRSAALVLLGVAPLGFFVQRRSGQRTARYASRRSWSSICASAAAPTGGAALVPESRAGRRSPRSKAESNSGLGE